jgi:outer membrane protein
MTRLRRFLFLSVLSLPLGAMSEWGTSAYAAEGRKLAYPEAEQLALSSSPALQAARLRLGAGRDGLRSTRGRLLPSIHLSEEYQHYSEPFSLPFPNPEMPLVARNQDTNTFVVAAEQPLLGIARGVEEYRGQQNSLAANEAQLRVAEDQIRSQVRVGYLRYFEAKALQDIARSSQHELGEQVTVAQARVKAGVLTNADVLRVQVALGNAQQQEIVARTQADIARASLFIACGLTPDDSAVDLVEPSELLKAGQLALPAYANARAQSLSARPEIIQGQRVADTADRQRRARMFALLPDLNLNAAYVRVDGQIFAPQNSLYVGLKAQWAIWEWGTTYYAYKAARAQAEAALLDLEGQRRQIAIEVATELLQTASAQSAVQVAQQSIASAEEAYRVTQALVKAGAATTTDLLDSQSALNQARLSLTRAQYQQAIAHVELEHTLGPREH